MLLTAYFITHLLVCIAATKPGQKESKAGISWPVQEDTSDPVQKFFPDGSKLSWHYNWNKNYGETVLKETTPGLKLGGEFVPMFFSTHDVDNELKLQEGYRYLMAFNEPDLHVEGVARYVPEADAVADWKKIALLREDGVKLVSPGVASDKAWLVEFMRLLDEAERAGQGNLKPDIINVHVYGTDLKAIQDKVTEYHDTFGLPVWVTEFAMHSFDGNATPPKDQQAVHDFMGQVTKWMDETDWIERYAWFGALRKPENLHGVHPFNRLMDEKGEVTALGRQYIGGGHK